MTGALALVTSAIVAAAMCFQTWLAWRQDRLAVVPRLRVDYHADQEEPFTITLRNVGVGPAEIRRFEVRVDGTPMPGCFSDPIREAVFDLIIPGSALHSWEPGVGELIPAGESIQILRLAHQFGKDGTYWEMRKRLLAIDVHVLYASLHGEEFSIPLFPGADQPWRTRRMPR